MIRIKFANDDLSRICTDQAHKMGLSFKVIKAARKTLIKIESAGSERDLFNLGGLNYKTRKEGGNKTRSVRINTQYRIFFELSGEDDNLVATITYIGDPY